jgi:hypothetical protein
MFPRNEDSQRFPIYQSAPVHDVQSHCGYMSTMLWPINLSNIQLVAISLGRSKTTDNKICEVTYPQFRCQSYVIQGIDFFGFRFLIGEHLWPSAVFVPLPITAVSICKWESWS